MNSEEAYQFSPNSVFEPPFEEETLSNSACVQNVDANLHGNDINSFVFFLHFIFSPS